MDRVAATGTAEIVRTRIGGRDMLVRTDAKAADAGTVVVQAALDLTSEHRQLDELLQTLLMVTAAGLVLAALAGSWLARRAVRPMEAALTLQRRFVADASHELRTPLTLLSTRAQMLRRRVRAGHGAAELQTDIDGVVADAERLAGILDDLLLAADPRSAGPDEMVDIAAVADDVVAAATPAATTAGMTISGPHDAGPAVVRGSSVGLRRALTALTDNAIRHASAVVMVDVSTIGRSVVVKITDDGPGIDSAMLPRLFDRFASTGEAHGVGPASLRTRVGAGQRDRPAARRLRRGRQPVRRRSQLPHRAAPCAGSVTRTLQRTSKDAPQR